MAAATLTAKGQVVIPAEIRTRFGLVPGTQVEFIDEGDGIRLVVKRRITPSTIEAGFGMVKPPVKGVARRLSEFDAADMLRRKR